jgi:hypothetical protein
VVCISACVSMIRRRQRVCDWHQYSKKEVFRQ